MPSTSEKQECDVGVELSKMLAVNEKK